MTVLFHRPVQVEARPGLSRSIRLALPTVVVAAKIVVVVTVLRLLLDPAWANLEGKAPIARAVMYPLWMVTVPALWALTRRVSTYPWLVDLLVTLTCVIDLVGNRLDLYNSVDTFDDWVHFLNAALVSAAFVIVAVDPPATFPRILEAAVSFGLTASLAWELFEYGTFLTRTTEWTTAYPDTIGDLALGLVGSVAAAVVVAVAWRLRGQEEPKGPALRDNRPCRRGA